MTLSPDSLTHSAESITESLLDRISELALDLNAELDQMRQQGVAKRKLRSKHRELRKLVLMMLAASEKEALA